MIDICSGISINEDELMFETIQSGGPGGQNVNKVATAVLLRFDVDQNESLPEAVKQRLVVLAGKRMTRDGVLIIRSMEHRTQLQNREAAIARFVALVKEAARIPVKRKATRIPVAAQERRLAAKKVHSEIKRLRQKSNQDWD